MASDSDSSPVDSDSDSEPEDSDSDSDLVDSTTSLEQNKKNVKWPDIREISLDSPRLMSCAPDGYR